MNKLLIEHISKRVTEALQKDSEKLQTAIFSNIPDDAQELEAIPIMLTNAIRISIQSSVCTTLEFLDDAGYINLPNDEMLLRKLLLTVVKD